MTTKNILTVLMIVLAGIYFTSCDPLEQNRPDDSQKQETTDPEVKDVLLTQGAVLTAMSQPNTDPKKVQEVTWTQNGFEITVRPVRPIPNDDSFFENVWRGYRENQNIY
jgi:hypothetical protein